MNRRQVLARYPLFDLVEPCWLDAWLAVGEAVSVGMGETVFQSGTPGRYLFLVQQGRVRVLRPSAGQGEVSFGTYGPGEMFGEYALLPPGLNTATCRAASPGRLLRLPLAPLRDLLAQRPDVWPYLKRWLRLNALLGYRRGGLFLGFMSAASLVPLMERCQTVRFSATHAIQAEGLNDDRWFVIESGEVALHPQGSGPSGPPTLLGPGQAFGTRALLNGRGLPLAVCHADSECLCLRRESFFGSLDSASVSQQTTRIHVPVARPFVWVGQREVADCGLAALVMVARYHEVALSLPQLRCSIAVGPAGVNLLTLERAATALGFRAQAVRLGLDQLAAVRLPAIAHCLDGHYVVVWALSSDGVVVGDPASGILTLPLPAFQQSWSRNLLIVL